MEFLSTSAPAHPRFQPLLTSLGTDEWGEGWGWGGVGAFILVEALNLSHRFTSCGLPVFPGSHLVNQCWQFCLW